MCALPKLKHPILGLITVLFLFSGAYSHVFAGTPARLFILHSYEKGHVCGQPQHDGIVAELKERGYTLGEDLKIKPYYMDTKKKNNTPELIREQANLARKKIRNFAPDILITLDDNAFKHVGLKFVDSGTPVVFSGMNGQPEKYDRLVPFMDSWEHPGHNITGVYEKLHISDAARVHSKLFPELEKLTILVDKSPTGRALTKQIKIEIKEEGLPCEWEMKTITSWEEYKKAIRAANSSPEVDAIYPAALLLKDSKGKTYTAPEIFNWTAENSRKPELGINYSFTRMGLFGGAAVDFFAMGKQAGDMVAKILEGKKAGNIPLEKAKRYALVFNLKRAEELGIKIPREVILAADKVIGKDE